MTLYHLPLADFFSSIPVTQTSLPHLGQPRAMSHLITQCQFMPLNVCTFLVLLVWNLNQTCD